MTNSTMRCIGRSSFFYTDEKTGLKNTKKPLRTTFLLFNYCGNFPLTHLSMSLTHPIRTEPRRFVPLDVTPIAAVQGGHELHKAKFFVLSLGALGPLQLECP
eukprot:TRINITY_DN2450_c0_g1_i13.p2 TRINITY_DN2450_c0_g1~~TRINITY_DN2450_c0_g1_i13.p2  ORF type:complete len:102 (+),score=12.95 TRINITY_DN2450_c0_g1_i13:101-406(+)